METGNIIKELSKKIQGEAIQRTAASDTHKGYDTDGYGYQYIVDRLNEVCGNEWGFAWKIIKELEGEYKSGAKFHEIVTQVDIWVLDRANTRGCAGGHISMSYADALKGAITNGFKKTAAFWGVGRDAYAGTIDDDNVPLPDSMENIKNKKTTEEETAAQKEYKTLYAEFTRLMSSMTEGLTTEGKRVAYEDTFKKLFPGEKIPKFAYLTDKHLKAFVEELTPGAK